MCSIVTLPVRLFWQAEALRQRLLFAPTVVRAFRLAGLTKPTKAWNPGGPNSWKYAGSPAFEKASLA